MRLDDLVAMEASAHMGVYARQRVCFVRGEGCRLFDSEGRKYLDFVSGLAVMSVGHAHPKIVAAIAKQAALLSHVSNLYYTEPQVRLAARLRDLLGWGKVFFANSGAESNECAIKLARRWARTTGHGRRDGIVTALGSFHGRTLATLAATGQPAKHEPFAPLGLDVTHVPLGDISALEAAVGDSTGAVMLEVVQGEGGVRPAPEEFLRAARRICDERGALLVFDEVQTGLGRTGRWFAFQHSGVVPDVITLAKALGAGLPIGACIARDEVAGAFGLGDHATTFGGGPIPCAAALAVLEVIESEGLVERARAMGERLLDGLRESLGGMRGFVEARGLGLLIAVELSGDWAAEVVREALVRGLVVNSVAPNAIRLAPPLTVGAEEIDRAIAVLAETISARGGAG